MSRNVRKGTPSESLVKLTRREREIMDAIFALGNRASAEDIRGRLSDPPSSSAVRAMLARLEGKRYIRHFEEGLRYVYAATISPAAAQRGALEKLVRVFFSGSPYQTASALLRQADWTPEELDTLGREIERVRRNRG